MVPGSAKVGRCTELFLRRWRMEGVVVQFVDFGNMETKEAFPRRLEPPQQLLSLLMSRLTWRKLRIIEPLLKTC
jgi:hypothetical protein